MTAKIIIFLSALTALLIAACYIFIKAIVSNRKKIKELKATAETLKVNMSRLVNHAKRLEQTKISGAEFYHKIEKAKNDEEINNIVAGIILSNNNRVQEPAKS